MSKAAALVAAAIALTTAAAAAQSAERTSDIVIRGGSIFDGASARHMVGDVAILGDNVVYVGPGQGNPFRGRRLIDAKAIIAAPGFIDPHTHADVSRRARGGEAQPPLDCRT